MRSRKNLQQMGQAQQYLKDEVLRKISSNLLLFQQIEGLLKLILGTSHTQGKAGDLKITHRPVRIDFTEIHGFTYPCHLLNYLEGGDEFLSSTVTYTKNPA